MLKKIIVVLALLLLVGFSFSLVSKTEKKENPKEENKVEQNEKMPETMFVFAKDALSDDCLSKNEQFCAVESAVKCTINPDFAGCHDLNLPKFVFMQDSSLDRPTEMSYKIVSKRVLPNGTVEIHTDSTCNGGWFGLCQGKVIYVLAETAQGGWFVKDIYAIE